MIIFYFFLRQRFANPRQPFQGELRGPSFSKNPALKPSLEHAGGFDPEIARRKTPPHPGELQVLPLGAGL